MNVTIRGMQLKGVLYLFKDAVARTFIANMSTKMAEMGTDITNIRAGMSNIGDKMKITQDDIETICVISKVGEMEEMEGE